jgi:hypothetical protein
MNFRLERDRPSLVRIDMAKHSAYKESPGSRRPPGDIFVRSQVAGARGGVTVRRAPAGSSESPSFGLEDSLGEEKIRGY